MAIAITEKNVEQEVKNSDKPVVIDVYATWCGPCQMMAPVFEELEQEIGDSYKFAKINVDEARDLSIEYGITSIPTFIFVKNGEIKAKETGFMNKEALKELINRHLG